MRSQSRKDEVSKKCTTRNGFKTRIYFVVAFSRAAGKYMRERTCAALVALLNSHLHVIARPFTVVAVALLAILLGGRPRPAVVLAVPCFSDVEMCAPCIYNSYLVCVAVFSIS